jgi:hypothetical protein
MWMVKRMFPDAHFKFVVLNRNPARAISGLVDGWLSNGFYSHNLAHVAPLKIKGYTRDDRPWTAKWWNFDLPPGWAGARISPIEEVCGLQWLRATEKKDFPRRRGRSLDVLRPSQDEGIERPGQRSGVRILA